jgi:hypothetical protein
MKYLMILMLLLQATVNSFKGGGTALSPTTKFRVYCSVKEAMRKAKELLDEVPPDEIPTVMAVKIMQYETAAKDAKEVLAQALAQADKNHEETLAQALTFEKEKIEWRRAHFQRISVVSQRYAFCIAVVASYLYVVC